MPENNSGNSDNRNLPRSRQSDTSWVIVAIAVIAGSLLGFVLRPSIVNLANGNGIDSPEISGLTELEQTQVNRSISDALTPVTNSLNEIKAVLKPVNSSGDDPTLNTERISSELDMLRLKLNDQLSYVEQLIRKSDEESRTNLEAFVAQTAVRLGQLDELGSSVNQLAAELPQLRNTVRTLRPAQDDTSNSTGNSGTSSVLESANESAPGTGTLVINNTSGASASITVNGQPQILSPGRNVFMVPLQQVEVRHAASDTLWNLDPSLWERSGDQFVINRKWVF